MKNLVLIILIGFYCTISSAQEGAKKVLKTEPKSLYSNNNIGPNGCWRPFKMVLFNHNFESETE